MPQRITSISSSHDEGGNLAHYLSNSGYIQNTDLFVFNYPNEDAVVHNATKFKSYLDDLASYVYYFGSNQQKIALYGTKNPTSLTNYKVDIVGHSMGGLIARYYIENLGHSSRVAKLITIGTPHWGSYMANQSCVGGAILGKHKLCDHDLRTNSKMFDGTFTTILNCNV
ncbi:MAG: alpha/beta fold hydrolase, partial [Crenarchaeota archaeon]|nr:alpha/beta fold hydrolase [Thermoproteota archaeon]